MLNTIGSLLQRVAAEGVTRDWAPLDLRTHLADADVAFIMEEALAHVGNITSRVVSNCDFQGIFLLLPRRANSDAPLIETEVP